MYEHDVRTLRDNLRKWSKDVQRDQARRELLQEDFERLRASTKEYEKELELYQKVAIFLHRCSEFAREQARVQLERNTTRALQSIFERDVEFHIDFVEKRGNIDAEFTIDTPFEGTRVKTNPTISNGGGVVDVVSLALRLSFLASMDPKIDGPLLLDEPGKHVSADYIFNLGELLKEATNSFGRQVIMVTHNAHLAQLGDRCFYVENHDGKSFITENPVL